MSRASSGAPDTRRPTRLSLPGRSAGARGRPKLGERQGISRALTHDGPRWKNSPSLGKNRCQKKMDAEEAVRPRIFFHKQQLATSRGHWSRVGSRVALSHASHVDARRHHQLDGPRRQPRNTAFMAPRGGLRWNYTTQKDKVSSVMALCLSVRLMPNLERSAFFPSPGPCRNQKTQKKKADCSLFPTFGQQTSSSGSRPLRCHPRLVPREWAQTPQGQANNKEEAHVIVMRARGLWPVAEQEAEPSPHSPQENARKKTLADASQPP